MVCTKEEMIHRVKDCGQEIIDNAENIVNDFKYGTELNISCYINWCDNGETPRINIETEFIPERFIARHLQQLEKKK